MTPLTADQLTALRCFSSFTEAVALVADPTAAAIATMKPVDGYWVAGAMTGGHIGPPSPSSRHGRAPSRTGSAPARPESSTTPT
ncbi:hypothetical protein [Tsukamurella pseudospumae]|uniref:Uncharacterized protein n=1 Tax=Tsukamurella pseudospumae TaxID=239498 RepID=A0A137ZRR0_9ACTN|nr:hypothetical protein [Tsukamurella pseudospumae]KXP00871.1 hypothetical protein AXK61_12745 [Tsukamurella pseudospumae]